ncbi:MAG: hypothetical protein RIQ72_200 [Candidatus Parcubacteria bacterium]|jgi:hypothetical protein
MSHNISFATYIPIEKWSVDICTTYLQFIRISTGLLLFSKIELSSRTVLCFLLEPCSTWTSTQLSLPRIMNTLLTTLMQIICNCFSFCARTTALVCGDIGSLHLDTQLLMHWPALHKHCRDVQTSFRHAQDPHPELGDKKLTARVYSLSYADIRKIVSFYSNLNPQFVPNTVDALMWAQQHSLITTDQLDEFLKIWTRPC